MADQPQINISRIPVAGIGGLGLVIMAAVIMWVLPEIRLGVGIALVGGLIVGGAYIVYRRRQGPLNWDKTWKDKPESKFHHL